MQTSCINPPWANILANINTHNKQSFKICIQKSPKDYWKYLYSLNKSKKTKTPPIESLHDFFQELNSAQISEDDDAIDGILNGINLNDDDQFLNTPITAAEILKCIQTLKNSKAPGSNEVLNEYIKYTKLQLLPIYVRLFNLVLNTGIIPEKWVEGMIMPIYKNKGDPMNPENYRPITLLSCLGKLFTAVLNERLNKFLNYNSILLQNQAGFRKHYSTCDLIFVLHSIFELLKLKKEKAVLCIRRPFKAFDSVWRVGLWNKLLQTEINGFFLGHLQSISKYQIMHHFKWYKFQLLRKFHWVKTWRKFTAGAFFHLFEWPGTLFTS